MIRQIFYLVVFSLVAMQCSLAQENPANWTKDQLKQPADLAREIRSGSHMPIIINVGPGALIPHSIDAGVASTEEGIRQLKAILKRYDKNADIVVYCGCCPFAHCPNVRPAIAVLKDEKFVNYHLLNLPENINVDWIKKGYPVVKQ